jgi:PPOX class probable F420-dependent enzyme
VSRRDQIQLTEDEIADFLEEQRIAICATNGRDGWPHLMPLWYVVRDDELWAWTYAKSQKVRNIERDDFATLEVETGDSYDQLRGVMIKAHAVLHYDVETVTDLGIEIFARYAPGAGEEVREMVEAQAPKRVGLQFVPHEVSSWDHRKLGGVY